MARKNGIISADSHVNPPATMYHERVPANLKERAPRVESRGAHEVLVFEGREQRFGSLDSAAGTKFDKVKLQQQKAKSERAGGWDPHARIPDLDQDGVDAEVLFGSGASTTHNTKNLPTMIAGGANMGLKHGNYWRKGDTPLANVFLSILQSMGIEQSAFSDSTGVLQDSIFSKV